MKPTNNLTRPTLTDLYQLSMIYAYWIAGKHEDEATFDLFFRRCPFGGEYAIFAGLEECIRLMENFRFTEEDINFLKEEGGPMHGCEEGFFDWLRTLDCSKMKISAVREGTIVFPKIPLIRVSGPLAVGQLLETPFLNLVNFPTLIATNASRFRLAAGPNKTLLEFGLRRAQGPDGAVSASRYSYMGGFDGTSNVLASQLFGIPVKGTHAHAFISSFTGLSDLKRRKLKDLRGEYAEIGEEVDFASIVLQIRQQLGLTKTNEGELAAMIAYAIAFPTKFLALVDTYDTLKSGVPNFICVAVALKRLGYKPVGIRLDSGDLAFLSMEASTMFDKIGAYVDCDLSRCIIVASNDIDESILWALRNEEHAIDAFGIGTHLVTCKTQPALGGVYKLVSINGNPRIKLSNEPGKITIPGEKKTFRLYGHDSHPAIDLIMEEDERDPVAGEKILCRHPFDEMKRAIIIWKRVHRLDRLIWDGERKFDPEKLTVIKDYVTAQLDEMREDHLRPTNPAPYKVAVSESLYSRIRKLREEETPVAVL